MAERLTSGADVHAWAAIADQLDWLRPYGDLFVARPPYDDWFVGGELNLASNCVHRHGEQRAEQTALWWEGEPGDTRTLTFAELHAQVSALATGLSALGVRSGDRIALHMGWLPETVVAMMAAFHLGAEVTVIPIALPVEALASRLADFRPTLLFTQDGGWRRGAILPLKARADEAIESISGVQHTIVVRRTGVQVEWFEGDLWFHDVLAGSTGAHDAASPAPPTPTAAAHPVVAVYLANRRGRPVVIRLGAANLAVVALANHRYAMGEGEVFWTAADVSWLGALTHGVIGPLIAGTSTVMYEGTLDTPDPARAWQIIERYGVTSMVTSPSIVRALRNWSLDSPHETRTLRRVVTIGDRLEPDVRAWLSGVLGPDATLADAWGQQELGGIVAYDFAEPPALLPHPGFAILGTDGAPVADGEVGEWVMLAPWAGTMRSVDVDGVDPTSYHWTRHPGHYATGDLARRGADGHVEFLGRLDEVITVSGQLVSLTEVREVLRDHPFVADAEAFDVVDPHAGRTVGAALVLEPGAPDDVSTLRGIQDSVREMLGGLSRPRTLLLLDRFGEELTGAALSRPLAALAGAGDHDAPRVTWEQVLAAARP